MRGAAGGFLGLAAWAAGDVEEAIATFSDAVRSLHAAGNLVDELDSTVVLADMWVAAGRPAAPAGCTSMRCGRPPGTASRTRGPPPTCTSGLAELDRELDDLAGAEAHLETARVLGERASITENRHRWSVAMAAGAGRPRRPRHRRGAARPRGGAVPARLLPRRPPDRRDEGPAPDRRGRPGGGSGLGRGARTRRRRCGGLPARVRAPDPGPAAPGPAPRERAAGARRLAHRCCTRCSTGCTTRPPKPDATAACWRSGCCRPSPVRPTVATAAWRSLGPALGEHRSRTAMSGCTSTRVPRCCACSRRPRSRRARGREPRRHARLLARSASRRRPGLSTRWPTR